MIITYHTMIITSHTNDHHITHHEHNHHHHHDHDPNLLRTTHMLTNPRYARL